MVQVKFILSVFSMPSLINRPAQEDFIFSFRGCLYFQEGMGIYTIFFSLKYSSSK